MNCSTPGLPIHYQFPEFTQTHVHRVGDAIQLLSHPLSAPSPPAPNPSSIRVFSNESTLCMRWQYWSFSFSISPSNEHPGLISFRMASGRFKLGQSSWGKKLQTFIGGRSLPLAGLCPRSPEISHCIPSLVPSLLCSHSTSWGSFCSNWPWQLEHPSEPALVDLF